MAINGGTPASIEYDPAGNITLDEEGRTYTYDEQNRLVTINAADSTLLARYMYDALGRRIYFDNPGSGVTRYYYDGQSVIEECDSSGLLKRYHVHGGQYIDEHIATFCPSVSAGASSGSDESYYYMLNDLYTVVGIGDEDGNVVEDYEYSAYGLSEVGDGLGCMRGDMDDDGDVDLLDEVMFIWTLKEGDGTAQMLCAADMNGDGFVDGRDLQLFTQCRKGDCPEPPSGVSPMNTPYTLHGRPVDRLSDGLTLQYNRARYYDITNGRWLQRDPKGYVDGGNLYEAFGGNPSRFNDPRGTDKIEETAEGLVYISDDDVVRPWMWQYATKIGGNHVVIYHPQYPFAFLMDIEDAEDEIERWFWQDDFADQFELMDHVASLAAGGGTSGTDSHGIIKAMIDLRVPHATWRPGNSIDDLPMLIELANGSRLKELHGLRDLTEISFYLVNSGYLIPAGAGAELVEALDVLLGLKDAVADLDTADAAKETGVAFANIGLIFVGIRGGRGSAMRGGFASGIDADEIVSINRRFANGLATTGDVSVVLANASRRTGFYNKCGSIIRDITGGHLFMEGNKRTTQAVIEALIQRNGIVNAPSAGLLRSVIHRASLSEGTKGALRSADEIAQALRGY